MQKEAGMEKKTDRRVRRTQRLLGEALVALVLEKGYDAITIKDITERADVAYVTFFRNFKNKDELILHRWEEEVGVLRSRIEGAAREAQQMGDDIRQGFLIFEHTRENAALYRALLSSQGGLHVRKRIKDLIAAIFLRTCKYLQGNRLIPAEIAANHIAASLMALVEWWLEHDTPYSSETMARIYDRLIIAATLGAERAPAPPVRTRKAARRSRASS